MNRALLFFTFALALFVAGCGGQAPVTKIGDDVQSICIESRSEYAGYRDFCDVTRTCPASEKTTAKTLHDRAAGICNANPADTAANRAAVRAILSQQRAVGYAK